MTSELPGGPISARPLHFIWIVDCSGSMQGEKIQSLNFAIRTAIPAMRQVAKENVRAQVLVRAIKFSDSAFWHIATPTPIEDFEWVDLTAGGLTAMGEALRKVAEQLKMPPMPPRALPPVLVLISDGQPTDDFDEGLKALLDLPWGKKAVRIAIAIGNDADLDVLRRFVNNPEIPVLVAHNSPDLVRFIRWASTDVLKAASQPPSQPKSLSTGNVPIPKPPEPSVSDPNDPDWVF